MIKKIALTLTMGVLAITPALAERPDFYGEDGKRPPQFVLLSFDGGADLRMWKDTLQTAENFEQDNPGSTLEFTYFFSGSYVIPKGSDLQQNYLTPGWSTSRRGRLNLGSNGWGAANEADGSNPSIQARLNYLRQAVLQGHLIGSHAVSHANGAGWTVGQWTDEFNSFFEMLKQAPSLVKVEDFEIQLEDQTVLNWVDFVDNHVKGFRAPLLGNGDSGKYKNSSRLFETLEDFASETDSSDVRVMGDWPLQKHNTNIWNIGLGWISKRVTGRSNGVIAMDYNMVQGKYSDKQALAIYHKYFNSSYLGKRGPVVIGHHFGAMGGGRNSTTGLPKFWHVLKDFAVAVCRKPEVHCVNYEKYRKWLVRNDIASKVTPGKWVNQYKQPFMPYQPEGKTVSPFVILSPNDIENEGADLENALETIPPHDCSTEDPIK